MRNIPPASQTKDKVMSGAFNLVIIRSASFVRFQTAGILGHHLFHNLAEGRWESEYVFQKTLRILAIEQLWLRRGYIGKKLLMW